MKLKCLIVCLEFWYQHTLAFLSPHFHRIYVEIILYVY